MAERKGCPSCDRDLSYPGQPGHICFTYAEQAERVEQAARERAAAGQGVYVMPPLWEGDQA